MKKSIVALLHVGFWGCYLVLIFVILGVIYGREPNVEEQELRIEKAFEAILFFALVPSAISFYSFYFLLFPKNLHYKSVLLSSVYGILISLVAANIGYSILTETVAKNCVDAEASSVAIIIFMAFIALICGIIALVIKGFIKWFDEIKLKEALQQKTHEMELALVKSQLDPHFLFNTLNNIDVLILKNATEASNYLNKLSDIMRFMLFETKTDKILLSKEIEYIEKYIELQKIRTSNLDYVHFSVKGVAASKTIAPMVFIPFIENAFKHTTNKKLENAINISVQIEKETIKLVCENKYDSHIKFKEGDNGLGNELIQKRLNLIYPQNHTLEVTNQNDLYSVHLTLATNS